MKALENFETLVTDSVPSKAVDGDDKDRRETFMAESF